jgi:hypothetical protein
MEPTWPKKRTSFHAVLDFGWEGPMIALILAAMTFLAPVFDSVTNLPSSLVQALGTNTVTNSVPTGNGLSASSGKTAIITNAKARITMLIVGGFFAVLAMWSLAYKSHFKRTYYPTWEIHFEEEFEKPYMTEARSKAAGVLLQYAKVKDWNKIKNKGELEPVLDFFDNLGLHQGFCHYLLIYCQEGFSFIQERQRVEKSTWEYIENLANEVFQIEAAKQGCSLLGVKLDPERYQKYMLEELGQDEDYEKEFTKAHPELFADQSSNPTISSKPQT